MNAVDCPPGPHTHSITDACTLIGCDSEDWIIDRVRNGTFPGRKIVRQVRFSDADISSIIDLCAISARAESAPVLPILNSRRARA